MTTKHGLRRQAGRIALALICTVSASAVAAQSDQRLSKPVMRFVDERVPSYNLYGLPGLIDMPTAEMAPDATLGTSIATFGNTTRASLSFQVLPRVIGSFRYSQLRDTVGALGQSAVDGKYYDRSFDLRFQLLKEGTYLPDLSVGLQDFIGTGLGSAEYIVATKEVVPGLRFTGGIGWGRLGSLNSFATTGDRPGFVPGDTGGEANFDSFFRGDVAAFGGVSYDVNDRFRVKLEYSSDDYELEQTQSTSFDRTSPWNIGLDYTFRNGNQLSLYHVYGTEVGFQLSILTNPRTAPVPGGNEGAPLPIQPRSASAVNDLGWTTDAGDVSKRTAVLDQLLDAEGITLEGVDLTERRARVRIQNRKYIATPQAVGRTARVMATAMPASIEEFVIVPTENGLPTSAVVVRRSDLEALEFDSAEAIYERAQIVDAVGRTPPVFDDEYPKFDWAIRPYFRFSRFDPENPLRVDYGIKAQADFWLTPSLEFAGSVSQRIGGNIADGADDGNNTKLPAVRTDVAQYAKEGDTTLDYLTLAHYGRPAEDFYSRLSLGYLERMYAGASGELLWKPVDSRLGLGAELNYIRRRDFDQGFGLQSNTTPSGEIPNVNGHLSAYYDIGWGFTGQVDVGRYLAGDYGSTLTLTREFGNGWEVGAYATFTDASAEQFGEGSFDKGITLTIPLNWALGSASRQTQSTTIKPLTRDGGARLNVRNRLYDTVSDNHQAEMAKTWGRFWR